MTEHDPFDHLDHVARGAARGLEEHVVHHLDTDPSRAARPAPRRNLGRVAIIVVVIAVVGASLATFVRQDEPTPSPDNEHDLPTPIALTPLGPRDGKASIGLAVAVEPSTGLADGQTITATGSGFTPNVQVAIVQCAIEAGRPAKGGEAAGVDGCDISRPTYMTSSSDGVASGDYSVSDHLTTPATGAIDCTIELGRCIIAMAEVSDYDRSGGYGIGFGTGEAVTPTTPVPTITVTPAVGLSDAQVVHVAGTDLTPGPLDLQVCSVDPAACWSTGATGVADTAVTVAADGTVAADVPAWRFLPGPQPRTYVDCAVSACNLVATTVDGNDPIPVRLGFVAGGPPPTGPALVVEPDTDVRPGTAVSVRGAGFEVGTSLALSFCIAPADSTNDAALCLDLGSEPIEIGIGGTLDTMVTVPPVSDLGGYRPVGGSTTTSLSGETTTTIAPGWPCDGATSRCLVRATLSYGEAEAGPLRPRFEPDAVPITYRGPVDTP